MSHGRLGSYEILERIGEGEMGVVFRARDPRLGREVALKVLREDLARDEECRSRLLREARAEARLSHENIAICFDVGEAKPEPADLLAPGVPGPHPESVLYIAMEFVPGANLDELITPRPMPLRRVLELALQMAAGLEAAHTAGLIHRDLKPGNVRVTPDGRAKILDFGLARVCRPEGSDPLAPTVSLGGSSTGGHVVGTPLYMSPEQASGEPLDARSDLFSFGVVLYELVTGQRPFSGVDAISAMYALANEQPPPLARFARDVPAELQRIVDKLLAKYPQDRYQSAHEVRTDLRRVYESLSGSSPPRSRLVGPTLRKRDIAVAAVTVLAVAAGAALWPRAHPVPAGPQSLAVLGFENMTGDSTIEFLSAGLAFDVVSDLVNYARLNVAPPSEVAKLATDRLTPKGAAHELGVLTVLTGAIHRLGQVTRLEVQLVDGRSGFPRWSSSYEIGAGGAYRVKREIVRSVASILGAGAAIESVSAVPAPPAEAYERYLRGIEAMSDINDPLAPERSAALLLEAVTLAPGYAAGWAARARALAWRYEHEREPALLAEAERCANEALRLEPDLVQGRVSRARIYRVTGRRQEAIADLDAALKINPNWDDVWVTLGALYRQTGEFDRAESAYRRAVDLRPESDRNWSQLGNFFVYAGRYADARAAYQRVIDLRPDLNRGYEALAAVFLSEGRFHEAITLYERLPHGVTSAVIASNVATAYFLAGRLDEALRNYLLSVSLEPRVAALRANLGDCYLRMRRPEEARIQYREAVRLNEADLQVSPDDPALHAQYIMHLAKAGDCAASAAAYRTHRTMLPDRDAEIQHMLARAFALCGRDGDAVAALGKMVALGASSELFRSEDEFISLRADSAFRSLVNGSRR